MTDFKMPERAPTDGPVLVRRLKNEDLELTCSSSDLVCSGTLVASPYNAARLFGMLALMLGIRLPLKLGKAIILTEPGKDMDMSMAFPEPKTLGDRLALALMPGQLGDFVKTTVEADPAPRLLYDLIGELGPELFEGALVQLSEPLRSELMAWGTEVTKKRKAVRG